MIGARVAGIELDGAVEVGECQFELAVLAVDVAAADIGDVVIGIDLDGAIVVGERQVVALQAPLDQRPVGVGLVEVRVELYRRVEVGDGFFEVACLAVGAAPHVVGAASLGLALMAAVSEPILACEPTAAASISSSR